MPTQVPNPKCIDSLTIPMIFSCYDERKQNRVRSGWVQVETICISIVIKRDSLLKVIAASTNTLAHIIVKENATQSTDTTLIRKRTPHTL